MNLRGNQRVVVVLGMHRSGTSAVTRGLQAMGVGLGDTLIPPVEGINPKGFWEDIDLNLFDNEVMRSLRSDWHFVAPVEPRDVESLRRNGYFLRAAELLRKKVGNAPAFGFKDPRVAKLLPFWEKVIGHCQFDANYVLSVRHPLSVVKSLLKRDGFEAEKSYLLWVGHVLESLSETAGAKRVLIDFDRLIQSPDHELRRIAKCLDFEIDPIELENYKSEFLDEELRHTVYDLNDLLLDDACPPLVREIYAALLDVASDRTSIDDAALQTRVARWVDEFGRLKSALTLVDRLYLQQAAHEEHIGSLNRTVVERDGQIGYLSRTMAERDGQIGYLSRTVAERDEQIDSLSQALVECDRRIAGLDQAVAECNVQIGSLSQALADRDGRVASLGQSVAERDEQIARLTKAVAEREEKLQLVGARLAAVLTSATWRVMAPVRVMKIAIGLLFTNPRAFGAYCKQHFARILGYHATVLLSVPPTASASNLASTGKAAPTLAFFTICSKNFTAYAKTLFASVRQHHPEAEMYMFLCDGIDSGYDAASLPFSTVLLDELGIPDVRGMAQRYNITEFNTAIKPYAFGYLFKKLGKDQVIYLDPDILVTSRMEEVVEAIASGAECVLTPHILQPAENVEVHDNKMLQFGIYNLGFLGLRNTPEVIRIIEWWGRRLEHDCVIDLANGLFVDQKWADLLPAFIKRTTILQHPGYNVAYWNLSQRTIELLDGAWYANRLPLRFVHFSGNKLDDPHVFSRHAWTFNRDNIGDLKYLLDSYRESVFANGHTAYSKLPYSFSWNGASGVNLHTPKPSDQPPAGVDFQSDAVGMEMPEAQAEQLVARPTPVAAQSSYWQLLRTAARMAGGWPSLAFKAARAFRRGGLAGIRQRAYLVKSYTEAMPSTSMRTSPLRASATRLPKWIPRLLFIDWSTPRPDRDAGSLTTFNLLKIYIDLGYDVTFVPSDLQYLGAYTDAIRALGVRCLHQEDIGSVRNHLEQEGRDYNFALLCRAPIATHYLADIRRLAPQAIVILNTSDLHYLRDIREAEIDGSPEKIEAAKMAKEHELGIVRSCDVTIVMSSVEYEILQRELTNVDVRLIPLMFVEIAPDSPAFSERKDFLFIGGFPHSPNIDAVIYFCNEILPLVRSSLPDIKFHIIGNAPPAQVLALADLPGVTVHGHIPDISPMFRASRLSVAPLRYGAGIKGKIGTSLSYGVPVVATSIAVEGMEVEAGKQVLVADHPRQFAEAIVSAYMSEDIWTQLSENGRDQMLRSYSPAVGHRRISALMKDINPQHRQIDFYTLRSLSEYGLLRRAIGMEIGERAAVERALIKNDQQNFFINGFCAICGCESSFNTSFMYSYETTENGNQIPNWREHLDCVGCGFTNRIRASMHLFYIWLKPQDEASIYITEQTTRLYKWLEKRHSKLIGSEYLADAVPFGTEKDGLRNEDLTALTFADDSFDYVLSFDVMEHVTDDIAALCEVYRCLKPGGTFLFAAPFAKDRAEKLVRARKLPDGSIDHIMPKEYHGNPVDQENGALCFRYFAWDLIEDMKAVGFDDPRVINYWSRDFAYLGGEQFIFIARKPI